MLEWIGGDFDPKYFDLDESTRRRGTRLNLRWRSANSGASLAVGRRVIANVERGFDDRRTECEDGAHGPVHNITLKNPRHPELRPMEIRALADTGALHLHS